MVSDTTSFFVDSLPRQLYLWSLLWLPALYWHRVARVFEDAEVSKPEIQRLIDACGEFAHDPSVDTMIATGFATPTGPKSPPFPGMPFPEEWTPPVVSPALARFKNSWELFVDTLMREWKTFNLVSALLCTTILTIFQIEDAAADPITRWSSLMSLVFALMSLSYGCVYIVQFGSMRSMDRASRWAEEAQKSRTAIWWNIWVLLATPAIWLAWSMISFCVAILSFVWRTGSIDDTGPDTGSPVVAPLTARQALGVRVAITAVFAFGLFNFFMIIRTFSSYSRLAVRRDRRGRFRRREADRDERGERGRERERARTGRPGEGTPFSKQASDSMVGLGLTGMGEAKASPGPAGVILENVDLEKGEGVYLSGDRVRALSAVSPKL
ncbi:uncharacterized protein TRAVEDRAFT_45020 [Trametes versicolor FP-101664 SS1]|uniref:uncharacterized protein n=1 Tax=Trametes versicolor (strain FP-101664) TaxID=717944 RepID=UPI0004622C17|nr:uncharacterized protein TRAVEDRAFT_45020 [Trametes versicolor FP-101664 SS1]EIW62185.1 hypothetical protein TRAVEDRAFT_45020 [Trametes versicolor FP-101664 SS1]